ncbi:MAG: hypothetical protein ACR2NB_15710 [Solirubrobacteraceae bacterium]
MSVTPATSARSPAVGGTSVAGIISSISSVKGAVKFVLRRVDFLSALGCAGTIVFDFA